MPHLLWPVQSRSDPLFDTVLLCLMALRHDLVPLFYSGSWGRSYLPRRGVLLVWGEQSRVYLHCVLSRVRH